MNQKLECMNLFSGSTGCAQHLAALGSSATGNKTPAELETN